MAKDQKTKKIEMVKIIHPHREEGWFVFTEYEIPLNILEEHGVVLSKTNPDIFAIFKDQVIWKIRDIFGL
jgi:hypothetical protein